MYSASLRTAASAASKFNASLDAAVGTVKTIHTLGQSSKQSIQIIQNHPTGLLTTARHERRLSTIRKSPATSRTADDVSSSTTSSSSSQLNLAYVSYEAKQRDEKERSRSPFIIQHGLFGCKENWKKVAKEMNFISRRSVFAVDGRNHGESPNTSDMSLGLMSDDLANFIQMQNYKKIALMGHNFGGRVAMMTALMYPNLIHKLVVYDATPLMPVDAALRHSTILKATAVLKNMTPELKNLTGYARVTAATKAISGIIKDKRDVALVLSNLNSPNGGGEEDLWRVNLDSILSNPYLTEFPDFDGRTFNGRTLFIQGDRSQYVKPGDEERIKKLFPRAEFAWIEDGGNFMHVEKHEIFVKTLFQFLDRKHLKMKEESK